MSDAVYIAVAPCGCVHGIETLNDASAAKQVAEWIRRGSTVGRVGLSEAQRRFY